MRIWMDGRWSIYSSIQVILTGSAHEAKFDSVTPDLVVSVNNL